MFIGELLKDQTKSLVPINTPSYSFRIKYGLYLLFITSKIRVPVDVMKGIKSKGQVERVKQDVS